MCESKLFGGIDFGKLEIYNLFLLGKQGWRLLHDYEFFMLKVSKAMYFPKQLVSSRNLNTTFLMRGGAFL